jgi:hypothetical protein
MRIPLVWIQLLRDGQAIAAWPLLLAICNQMRLKNALAVSITAKVWGVAAARSEQERRTMIQALKRVPNLVRL